MRFIVRFLKGIGNFLDHRFPERMTAEEVRVMILKSDKHLFDVLTPFNDRMKMMHDQIQTLTDQHNKMLAKITSLQVLSGIRGAMAERE